MRRPTTRTPVEWRQLCAIARATLHADPAQCATDWSEAIKCRIVALELTYPTHLEAIRQAMDAVERAYEKTHGPRRPVPRSRTTIRQDVSTSTPPWPRSGTSSRTSRWCHVGDLCGVRHAAREGGSDAETVVRKPTTDAGGDA